MPEACLTCFLEILAIVVPPDIHQEEHSLQCSGGRPTFARAACAQIHLNLAVYAFTSVFCFLTHSKTHTSGKLVVRFTLRNGGDGDADATQQWLHFAYANLKSWATGVVKLLPDTDWEAVTMSRVLAFIALRVAFVDTAASPWDRLCMSTLTMVFEKWDMEHSCDIALYSIIDDDVPLDVFCPAQVAVRELIANKDHAIIKSM